MPLLLPGAAAGLSMRGTILYAGPGGNAALTLGDGGSANNQRKSYTGLAVFRALQSDWIDEADVGIRIRNIDACVVDIRRAERFTIGVQLVGDARGCEDSDLRYGRIVDNRIGLDLRTLTAGAWMNSLRHQGGHFACSSATNPGIGRFGVRLSAAAGAYRLHNAHLFTGPAFELQRQGTPGTVDAIPFLVEVDGRGLIAHGRADGSLLALRRAPHRRLLRRALRGRLCRHLRLHGMRGGLCRRHAGRRHGAADAPGGGRARARRGWSPRRRTSAPAPSAGTAPRPASRAWPCSPAIPPGRPRRLNGFCFAGLSSIGLNADTVTLPTSRALAFVVDCSTCKEFFLAAEGSALRPMAMQFDAAETVLDGSAPALWSNMNAVFQGSAVLLVGGQRGPRQPDRRPGAEPAAARHAGAECRLSPSSACAAATPPRC